MLIETSRLILNGRAAERDAFGLGMLSVRLKESGERIGACGVLARNWGAEPRPTLCRDFLPGYENEYAAEAIRAVCARVFADTPFQTIFSEDAPGAETGFQLLPDGSYGIRREAFREPMDPRRYLEILHTAERLKDEIRHCTTSKGRPESVAEHSWRLTLMALLARGAFPEADISRVIAMCAAHDLGECFTGDIPTFLKTEEDRNTESRLLAEWTDALPEPCRTELTGLFRELEDQTTIEAKLCKALDKLEAVIQHNEAPIGTWAENEYELNRTYAFDVSEFSPWLMSLRKAILSETLEKIERES